MFNAEVIALYHLHKDGVRSKHGLPFVSGGMTEPKRAHQALIDPVVGLFVKDGSMLRYERI